MQDFCLKSSVPKSSLSLGKSGILLDSVILTWSKRCIKTRQIAKTTHLDVSELTRL